MTSNHRILSLCYKWCIRKLAEQTRKQFHFQTDSNFNPIPSSQIHDSMVRSASRIISNAKDSITVGSERALYLYFTSIPTKNQLAHLATSGISKSIFIFPAEDQAAFLLTLHTLGLDATEIERFDYFYHSNDALKSFVHTRLNESLSLENLSYLSQFAYAFLDLTAQPLSSSGNKP